MIGIAGRLESFPHAVDHPFDDLSRRSVQFVIFDYHAHRTTRNCTALGILVNMLSKVAVLAADSVNVSIVSFMKDRALVLAMACSISCLNVKRASLLVVLLPQLQARFQGP